MYLIKCTCAGGKPRERAGAAGQTGILVQGGSVPVVGKIEIFETFFFPSLLFLSSFLLSVSDFSFFLIYLSEEIRVQQLGRFL